MACHLCKSSALKGCIKDYQKNLVVDYSIIALMLEEATMSHSRQESHTSAQGCFAILQTRAAAAEEVLKDQEPAAQQGVGFQGVPQM